VDRLDKVQEEKSKQNYVGHDLWPTADHGMQGCGVRGKMSNFDLSNFFDSDLYKFSDSST